MYTGFVHRRPEGKRKLVPLDRPPDREAPSSTRGVAVDVDHKLGMTEHRRVAEYLRNDLERGLLGSPMEPKGAIGILFGEDARRLARMEDPIEKPEIR